VARRPASADKVAKAWMDEANVSYVLQYRRHR
jgi:hypothetical protein